jgi:hypothetical protein
MLKKWSIQVKFFVIFLMTLLLLAGSFVVSLNALRTQVLRNEAAAVADQVISFRAWVARAGMVWVTKLSPDFKEFLAQRDFGEGQLYYGKNPALATRELSQLANASSSRATFTVTSDEYRHDDNAPDAFEERAITAFKQDRELKFTEGYTDQHYRYARPILVKEGCLKCHGDPKDAPHEVIEKYGDQKAFGYKIGQVRGIVSVKLPDIGFQEVGRSLINPYSIGLVAAALILNVFFTYRFVIRRLVILTEDTELIASGKLNTVLEYTDPKKSNDELDHLCHAVDLLKRSLIITFKKLQRKK